MRILENIKNKEIETVYPIIKALENGAIGFVGAIYVLFLLDNGLDVFQVTLVNTSFMIANFVFEVPTGVIADIFGRKRSSIIGLLFLAFGMLVYFFGTHVLLFILAEIVFALGVTLRSGALEAWVYDNMNDSKNFQKLESKAQSYYFIAPLISAPLGGLIASYSNLRAPLLVSALILLLTTSFSMLFMKSDKSAYSRKGEKMAKKGAQLFAKVTKEGARTLINSRSLLLITIAFAITNFAFQPLNMFWTVLLQNDFELDTGKIGIVFSLMSVSMSIGTLLAGRKILSKVRVNLQFVLTSVVIAAGIILALAFQNLYIFLFGFLLHEVSRGYLMPIKSTQINKNTPSKVRATVNSLHSMIYRLGAAIGLPIFGWITLNYSIQTSWMISAIVILLSGTIYLFLKTKPLQQPQQDK